MKDTLRTLFGWKYRHLVKPVLFRFPADDVHEYFLSLGRLLGQSRCIRSIVAWLWRTESPMLQQTISDLVFSNPVGLSAGFDYRADLVGLTPSLGFGFHSIGTLTLGTYSGNPRPMLDRLPKSRSLLVNKGFKNEGIATVLARLSSRSATNIVRGVSIGATNRSFADFPAMLEDIVEAFRVAEGCPYFSYYELNISCPNLQNQADVKPSLASSEGLAELLAALTPLQLVRPVFIKLPLERTETEMQALIAVAVPYAFITGLIFSNLAKDRNNPAFDAGEIARAGRGNFSGKPTETQSNALLRFAYRHYRDRFILIGTGGIFSAEDAYIKIRSGASFVQLITGIIYEGPQVIGAINAGLVTLLHRDGYANVREAIGVDASTEVYTGVKS